MVGARLMECAQRGDAAGVRALLAEADDQDLDHRDDQGWATLHWAAYFDEAAVGGPRRFRAFSRIARTIVKSDGARASCCSVLSSTTRKSSCFSNESRFKATTPPAVTPNLVRSSILPDKISSRWLGATQPPGLSFKRLSCLGSSC